MGQRAAAKDSWPSDKLLFPKNSKLCLWWRTRKIIYSVFLCPNFSPVRGEKRKSGHCFKNSHLQATGTSKACQSINRHRPVLIRPLNKTQSWGIAPKEDSHICLFETCSRSPIAPFIFSYRCHQNPRKKIKCKETHPSVSRGILNVAFFS